MKMMREFHSSPLSAFVVFCLFLSRLGIAQATPIKVRPPGTNPITPSLRLSGLTQIFRFVAPLVDSLCTLYSLDIGVHCQCDMEYYQEWAK